MQSKWYAWLVVVLGVLLLLPKIGVMALGDLNTGAISWLVPIIVVLVGVIGLFKIYRK